MCTPFTPSSPCIGDNAYFIEAAAPAVEGNVPAEGEDWGRGGEGDPVGIITIEDVIEEVCAGLAGRE